MLTPERGQIFANFTRSVISAEDRARYRPFRLPHWARAEAISPDRIMEVLAPRAI
jgi:hypothetical protein